LRLRHEARHDRKAHAMASRTKDNLQVFSGSEDKTADSDKTQEDSVVDLKHLFTKHDRRVPHLPSEKIPDRLSMMKERQKQRQLAREEEKQAEAAKVKQQKLDTETPEADVKHKKLCLPSHPNADKKRPSAASSSILLKSDSADKRVESMAKVKKKNHQPPPMSFEQLMALAKQKQAEPVIDVQPADVTKKMSTKQERPMTQEEKDRQKRRETKEYQDWLKYGGAAPSAPSSKKSRQQQHADEPYKGQRVIGSSKISGNDSFDESDSETDQTVSPEQSPNIIKSYSHSSINTLKGSSDMPRKQSSAARSHSEKLSSSRSGSSYESVDHSRPVSRGEAMFTKGKVISKATRNEAGQNGKSKNFSDELIEKLKEERRQMADRGDAVPSLADMLQELLNKVQGSAKSQESTPRQSVSSETRSLKPSSCSMKSKKPVSEQKVDPVKSVPGGSRARSGVGSGPRSSYVIVNETVVDCERDKLSSTKPLKSGDKRPMKSTWEEMYERAKSKNPNCDRGILFAFLVSSVLMLSAAQFSVSL